MNEFGLYSTARVAALAMFLIYVGGSVNSLIGTLRTDHSSAASQRMASGISEYVPIPRTHSGALRIVETNGGSVSLTCPSMIFNAHYRCHRAAPDWAAKRIDAVWLDFEKGFLRSPKHRAIRVTIDGAILFQATPQEVYDAELASDINSILVEIVILLPLILFFNFIHGTVKARSLMRSPQA
jgi:hypothetical protein